MKKYLALFAAAALSVMALTSANASTYIYTPYDSQYYGPRNDVFDFDHNYLYFWGINTSDIPSHSVITDATLTIKNINNWDNLTNILKIYLLDNVAINDQYKSYDIISIKDSSSTSNEVPSYTDKFADSKFLTNFVDGNTTDTVDQFFYSFKDNNTLDFLAQYLSTKNVAYNSNIGIGFDPDCHFFNDGVTLTITTAPVPEPGTFLLLGAGLIGLGVYGRRRSKK